MRWNIEAADPQTGREQILTIDAPTRAEAERIVRKRGLLVGATHEATTGLTTADKLDAMIDAGGAAPAEPAVPAPLAYRSPSTMPVAVPPYSGLVFAAGVLRLFALLAYAGGAIYLLLAVVGFTRAMAVGQGTAALMTAVAFLLLSMTPLAVGALLHGAAAAALALRDIAQNSFRLASR